MDNYKKRKSFDMPIYLDYNATSPVLYEVLEVIIETYKKKFGNAASRTHLHGHVAKQQVDNARKIIADVLNVSSNEVIFTSGATESNNISLLGFIDYAKKTKKKHIVSSVIEHSSILGPLEYLSRLGFKIDFVPVRNSGRISVEEVLERVNEETLLVSIMHANNETGVIQPVEEIGEYLADKETIFHVDAAQTFGKLVDELKEIKYDLLSITAHKVYGPQGIGALVVRNTKNIRPLIKPLMYGGNHERGLRPGTLPVALISGFGKAAELSYKNYKEWNRIENQIKKKVLEQLQEVNFVVNGEISFSLPNCINISFPGIDSEALMLGVKQYLSISNGSACTSSEYKPSYVLKAMGADAESAVRISWGPFSNVDLTPILEFVHEFT